MICPNCGTNNAEGVGFCVNCGAAVNAAPVQPAPAKDAGKGFAIASMVLGIVSLFIFGYIAGALAIIFSVVAKKKGSTSKMATAGLVLGIIGVAGALLVQVVCGAMVASLGLA